MIEWVFDALAIGVAGVAAVYREASMTRTKAEMIDELIEREGGSKFTDHPLDRGGPTRWGVTEQVARAFGFRGDMRALPRETAVAIYDQRYWTGPGLQPIADRDPRLAEELFDIAVNMGPARAGMILQRALNVLNDRGNHYPDIGVDGAMGPMTRAALDGYRQRRGGDPAGEGARVLRWVVKSLRTGRYVDIMEANPSQEAFGYGWFARQVRELAAAGL